MPSSSSEIEEQSCPKRPRSKHYFDDRKTCDISQLAKLTGDLGALKKKGKTFKSKKQHFQEPSDNESQSLTRYYYDSYS